MVHKMEEDQNVQKTVHMVYEWPLGEFLHWHSVCVQNFLRLSCIKDQCLPRKTLNFSGKYAELLEISIKSSEMKIQTAS